MNVAPEIVTVIGTDTGVGKTWCGCRLARALARQARRVRAIKLVETGTALTPEPHEDGVLLATAAGQTEPTAALRRYRTPVAAAEAADREQVPFDLQAVLAETRVLAQDTEITLVEGAGGLLAPLTWSTTMLDVTRALAATALLVSADRLGTLNHTLLTLGALERAGLRTPVVLLNEVEHIAEDSSAGSNAEALRRLRPDLAIVETATPKWEVQVLTHLLRDRPIG